MLFSLIVITYNSGNIIKRCLDALAKTSNARYEIIVVDNASFDDTATLVRLRYPNVRLIVNPKNVGFGAACNVGIAAAAGDAFVFLNPDVEVLPDWLEHVERHFNEYPDAAIICPTTLRPGQARSDQTGVAESAAGPGCALALRRTAWQEIGGFDPNIFLYWEDTELCWRAWLLGWRVLEDFDACVYHEQGASTRGSRWDAEAAKNGLYTHIKLRRGRFVAAYMVRMLAKTVVYSTQQRNLSMLNVWWWNTWKLPTTLRLRRHIFAQRKGELAKIERLVSIHIERGRLERKARQVSTHEPTNPSTNVF